jgi:hypothetical protein
MITNFFELEWISASAVDVRAAAVTTKLSASVDLMMLFMVFLLFKFSFDPERPPCPSSKNNAV